MHDQGQQQVVEQGEQERDRDGVPLQLGVETADRREGTGLCLIRRRDLEAAVDGYPGRSNADIAKLALLTPQTTNQILANL